MPEEVVKAGAKRKKKAATGEEQSAGSTRTQKVRGPQVRAVGQPASESNDLGDFEVEADDFEEVFSVETEKGDVCEAVQLLLPANIIASDAMDRLARRERWPPYDNEAEGEHFRVFVNCLLDAAKRGVLTTLTRTECTRLARNNMVWMGRAARYTSWEEVEANGVSYEELASRDLTAAIMDNLNQEAAEEGAPTDGAGPSQVAPREEGPSQEAAAHTRSGRPFGGPTFLLTPMVEDAVAYTVQGLAGGMELPWLDRGKLIEELTASVLKGLESIRVGVTTRPLRIVRDNGEGTGDDEPPPPPTGPRDGPQQPPPPSTGPRDGPQQPPPPSAAPREGPQSEPQGGEASQPPPAVREGPPTEQQGSPAGQEEPPADGDQPAEPEGPPAQSTDPTDGPPATSAMYVGTPKEYLAGATDVAPLLEMAEPGSRAMLAQGLSATRAKGHQLDERVKAPIFDTTKGGVWVNGKPITGVAILDTGAMPLLVGRAGMEQMGWTDEDVIPNAVRLGLADGKSTQLRVNKEDGEVYVQQGGQNRGVNRGEGRGD
jgi:hypothetical protein